MKNDEYVCDEHYKLISSIRVEPCYFTGCAVPVKIDAVPIDVDGVINNVSYKGAFVCKKHYISITKTLQKQANPCMYIVKSKNGEKQCTSIAVADGRCKKHVGKEQKEDPKKKEVADPKEEKQPVKSNSKKVDKKKKAEPVEQPKVEVPAETKQEEPVKSKKAPSKKKEA
jgi:hypothetical protein